jgi:hypothetical protein
LKADEGIEAWVTSSLYAEDLDIIEKACPLQDFAGITLCRSRAAISGSPTQLYAEDGEA